MRQTPTLVEVIIIYALRMMSFHDLSSEHQDVHDYGGCLVRKTKLVTQLPNKLKYDPGTLYAR